MDKLKLLIIEQIERTNKLEELKQQLKQEEKEFELAKVEIANGLKSYPTDHYHGDRVLKINVEDKELYVKVDRFGSIGMVKEIITLQ